MVRYSRLLASMLSAWLVWLATPSFSQTTANTPSRSPAVVSEEYLIRVGDVLDVVVWGHEDLSARALPVRPDGKISYPTIGDIYVVDQTPVKLSRIIALGLKKYLNNPNVSVTLMSSVPERYFVSGSVHAPGAYTYSTGLGVREAISAAGDLAPDANDRSATLIRNGQRIPVDLEAAMRGAEGANLPIQPNDTLSVDRALVAFQGFVHTTGQQALKRGSTLTQALASAGGTEEGADVDRVQVIRGNETIFANLREIAADHSKDVPLLPGDIVKVDALDDRSLPVFVSGAVGRQGQVRFVPGRRDNLENAINWAGGAASDADLRRVKVRRINADGDTVLAIYDLRTLEGRSVKVQANDYIEVPRKRKSNITSIVTSTVGVLVGILSIARNL